jgi:tetratricopeptide (TPR) repeat protein
MALNQAKVLKNAEKYLRQGKIDAAIAEYQQLVQENPKDLNTINKIGDLYARHGKIREAIAQFSKIAEFYSADGFLLKAIAIYKKINKLDPNYMEAYSRLADLYSQQGLVMEAKSQYQVVAEHYLKAGQLDRTRSVFEKLLKLAPDDLKTRLALAELLVKEKKSEEAVKEYLGVGQELDRRDMLKESARIYQTAHKLAPGNREVLDRLIRALSQQGEHDQVIELLKNQVKSSRDPGLMALLAQAYLGKDRIAEAKKLLEQAAGIDSEAVEIRIALGRLQLKQGELPQAFNSLSEASRRLEEEKKFNEACHLWEEFVRAQRDHVEALARLEQLYRQGDHPAKADATASELADLLIGKGEAGKARQVLERLVVSDAGNPRHRERLESLQAGGKPARSAPKPAARPRPEEMPEAEMVELELQPLEPAAERAPAPPARPHVPRPSVAPTALEELPESAEDEDPEFVSERLTEADVFVKYGLVDKALEQLQTVLQRFPRSVSARRKLAEIYRENGDPDRAIRECVQVARILREAGDGPAASAILEEAASFGGSAEAQALVQQAQGGEVEPQAPVLELESDIAPAPRVSAPLEDLTPEIDLDLPPEPIAAPAAPAAGKDETLEIELTPEEPPAPARAAAAESEETFEIEMETGSDTEPGEQELKEIDFYLEQGLEEEARAMLEKLRARAPQSSEVLSRLEKLSRQRPAAAPHAARPGGDANILQEIERELNEGGGEAAGTSSGQVAGGAGEFFDLSSELDESLFEAQTAVETASSGFFGDDEHSLEEIFKAFKKGVEQQVEATDYETHYNLGIAYKEMGLLEEAIGEFQTAAKDPRRLLECCSMLGMCFREKGMTNLALKWYQRGLESPNQKEEAYQGLKYDLAALHMEMGDYARAMELFSDVYGANAKYRDVSSKVRELERLIAHGK